MKLVTAADAEKNMNSLLVAAQKERIVVTRAGKPSVMLIGVESYDDEDWRWASDPEFWQMIRERRNDPRPGIPLAEIQARLAAREQAERLAKNGKRKTQRKANTTRRR